MSTIGKPGEAFSVEEILEIAKGILKVSIDPKALSRIKKESPKPDQFKPEEDHAKSHPTDSTARLSPIQTRASLFCILLRLIHGFSGARAVVLEVIANLLNDSQVTLPDGETDEQVLSALCALLKGDTNAGEDAIRDALGAAAPSVSSAERMQLQSGLPVSCGVLSIAVARSKNVLAVSSAALALTCEAMRASTKAFDAKIAQNGANKHSAAVAAEVLCFLEGSSLVNAKPKDGGAGELPEVPLGYVSIGDVQAALTATAAAARDELATHAAATPLPSTNTLAHAASALATAALTAAFRSLSRVSLLLSSLQKPLLAPLGGKMGGKQRGVAMVGTRQGLAGGVTTLSSLGEGAQPEVARGGTKPDPSSGDAKPECVGDGNNHFGCVADPAEALLATLMQECGAVAPRIGAAARGVVEAACGSDGVPPTLAAATAATAAEGVLGRCCALEALLATVVLKRIGAGVGKATLGKGTRVFAAAVEGAATGCDSTNGNDGGTVHPGEGLAGVLVTGDQQQAFCDAHKRVVEALQGRSVVAALGELRALLEAQSGRRLPKIPKGTRDFLPEEMAIRKLAFGKIEAVFERHGAVTIDTPVFELRETLMGKYGEDSKLIYDLADQGGELLSLRYDLTVPFARFVALNGVGSIKRYHIGKVYRRDNPAMNRGRFREFYQCDFDIAGSHSSAVADAEVVKVLDEILSDLDIGPYVIKLNHRRLLDAIMDISGVPPPKFRPICSAIDKLDKAEWGEVRREMTEEKGLPGEVANRIGEFVKLRGAPFGMLRELGEIPELAGHAGAAAALAELGTFFELLEAMGGLGKVSFDLSLARGLDYYTGVIYEAVLMGGKKDEGGQEVHVGSVAAGGRYDGLVGMYSGKDVPAVGVSIGIERVFSIMEGQFRAKASSEGKRIRETRTSVLVGSFGKGLQKERMAICSSLWAAGIRAEFGYKANQNFKTDIIGFAQDQGIPILVLFGEDELAQGNVNVKDMAAQSQQTVPRKDVATAVLALLADRVDSVLT